MNLNKINKFIVSLIIVVSAFTFNACRENSSSDIIPVSNAGQYLNLNTGSSWEYSADGSTNTTVVKVTDSTKLAFTKNYKIFHSTTLGVTTSNYYTYKNGNYYLLIAKTAGGYEELIYLKDSSEVGKKWSATVSPNGTSVVYNYEVKENGLTQTINGTTYTNVVHVKLTVPISGYTADAYYAPKVGLIKSDAITSGVTSKTELKSYTLK